MPPFAPSPPITACDACIVSTTFASPTGVRDTLHAVSRGDVVDYRRSRQVHHHVARSAAQNGVDRQRQHVVVIEHAPVSSTTARRSPSGSCANPIWLFVSRDQVAKDRPACPDAARRRGERAARDRRKSRAARSPSVSRRNAQLIREPAPFTASSATRNLPPRIASASTWLQHALDVQARSRVAILR